MRALRSWGTVVLLLGFMMVVAVPKDAIAEKGLSITKKVYLKAYNEQMSRLIGVRFEKFGEPTEKRVSYQLSNDKVIAGLDLSGPSEQLTNISITIIKVGSSQDELLVIMNLGIAIAVEPNPTTSTITLINKKLRDKFDQGLTKFSFEVGDKLIKIEWGMPVSVKITPL